MKKTEYPPGWTKERAKRVADHYESQSDKEAVAEDEAAFQDGASVTMQVPAKLAPQVRELIARHKKRA